MTLPDFVYIDIVMKITNSNSFKTVAFWSAYAYEAKMPHAEPMMSLAPKLGVLLQENGDQRIGSILARETEEEKIRAAYLELFKSLEHDPFINMVEGLAWIIDEEMVKKCILPEQEPQTFLSAKIATSRLLDLHYKPCAPAESEEPGFFPNFFNKKSRLQIIDYFLGQIKFSPDDRLEIEKALADVGYQRDASATIKPTSEFEEVLIKFMTEKFTKKEKKRFDFLKPYYLDMSSVLGVAAYYMVTAEIAPAYYDRVISNFIDMVQYFRLPISSFNLEYVMFDFELSRTLAGICAQAVVARHLGEKVLEIAKELSCKLDWRTEKTDWETERSLNNLRTLFTSSKELEPLHDVYHWLFYGNNFAESLFKSIRKGSC